MVSVMALSSSPWVTTSRFKTKVCSASFSMLAVVRPASVSLTSAQNQGIETRNASLHCSFLCSSPSLSSTPSTSGLSMGLDFGPYIRHRKGTRRGLVVQASRFALCQTKRNRSRKSLARTHGFRRRMRTTGGRAVLKRRRAKGRKVLCPKSNPSSGKRSSP